MPKPQQVYLIPLVTLLIMLGPFSVDTYLPAFPAMESAYSISTAAMSQTLGVFLLAFAVSTLAWGPLMDRFGRKSMVILSLLGFALASSGCALSTDYSTFLGYRIAQGLFASCGVIGGRAMIRDVYEGKAALKAMSRVMFFFAVGPAIAPIVGAWLLKAWGWQSIFWFLTVLGFSLALALLFLIRETQSPDHVQSIHPVAVLRTYFRASSNLHFMLLLFTMSTTFGGLFLYIGGASRVIYDFLQLSGDHFAVLFVPMVAGMMVGSWLAGKMSVSYSPEMAVNWGFAALVIAAVFNVSQAMLLAPTPFVVIAPMTLYAFGISILMPNIGVLVLDSYPKNRGMASAVQGFLYMGSNAMVASLLIPVVLGQLLWFTVAQAVLLVIGLILWRLTLMTAGKAAADDSVVEGQSG